MAAQDHLNKQQFRNQQHANAGWGRLDENPTPDPNAQPGDFTNINSKPKRIWGMKVKMGGSQ
jgi:hypothetical protein